MIMSYIVDNAEQAFTYAQTASKQAENILTAKYKFATASRFAIKSFETNKEFEKIVQNMLEIKLKSHNFCSSLVHYATALFFIHQKTGKFFDEALEYNLKASLFNEECNEQWDKIISKHLQQIRVHQFFMEQMRYLLIKSIRFGLTYSSSAKICEINVKHNIQSINRLHISNTERQEVRSLISEARTLLSKTSSDPFVVGLDVEEFIVNACWTEENYLKILKTCSSIRFSVKVIGILDRLLSSYNVLGVNLPKDCQIGLAFTYVRKVHSLVHFLFVIYPDNLGEIIEDLGNTFLMYPVAVMCISDHYRERNDLFMSCTILLEFVDVVEKLLPKLFDNLLSVKATWYHYCLRSMEIVIKSYSNHPLRDIWETKLEQFIKQKATIDVNIDQTINYSDEELDEEFDEEEWE